MRRSWDFAHLLLFGYVFGSSIQLPAGNERDTAGCDGATRRPKEIMSAAVITDRRRILKRSEEIILIVVARYLVTDGHESTVARLLRKNAEASRAEPGCLEFSVYQDIDHPRAFLLYERYISEDAFQAHRQTEHFKEIIEQRVVPLLDERAWTRVEPLPA